MPEKKQTQMQKLIRNSMVRIAIVEDVAYWVKDNQVFKSNFDEDGHLNLTGASAIDVFSLSEKETKKLLKIIDSLSD